MKRLYLFVLLSGMFLLISGCEQLLRFEGLYRAKTGNTYNYLRFYSDGTVLAASSAGGPEEAAHWFDQDNVFTKGYYKIEGSRLKFSIMDNYNIIDYEGRIIRKRIKLKLFNHYSGGRTDLVYRYIPLDLTGDYREGNINLNELLAPERPRVVVSELKKDLDSDGKLERILFDDDKQDHDGRPDEYRRMLIYNANNYLVFDSTRNGLDIAGIQFKDSKDYVKIEDNNKNGIPEAYLREKPSGNNPGRLAIIESDRSNYRVLFYSNLDNYVFEDLDHDGKQELYGDTGSSAWELLYYMDKTAFKQKGFKYLPSYELTWQLIDNIQNKADEDFRNHPGFENLQHLIALDAVLGLKDEGINLIKTNIELEKEPTNVTTTKELMNNFATKLQKYNSYWSRFKTSSEWSNLMDQVSDLYQQKRYTDTLELATKVVAMSKEVFGTDHLNTAVSLQNLAVLNMDLGKVNEGTALFKEAAVIINNNTQKNFRSFWDTAYYNLWCDNDFTLANLRLGMKEAEVLKLVGKPLETKSGTIQEWGETLEAPFKDLLYKGVTVRLVQVDKNEGYKVQQRLLVKSPRFSTLRGLKIGDSFQKVLLTYGEPSIQNQREMEYRVMYSHDQANYWKHLTFKLNPKGNIETIIVGPVFE